MGMMAGKAFGKALSLSSFLADPRWPWGNLGFHQGSSAPWRCDLRPSQAPLSGSSVATSVKSAWGQWPPP